MFQITYWKSTKILLLWVNHKLIFTSKSKSKVILSLKIYIRTFHRHHHVVNTCHGVVITSNGSKSRRLYGEHFPTCFCHLIVLCVFLPYVTTPISALLAFFRFNLDNIFFDKCCSVGCVLTLSSHFYETHLYTNIWKQKPIHKIMNLILCAFF